MNCWSQAEFFRKLFNADKCKQPNRPRMSLTGEKAVCENRTKVRDTCECCMKGDGPKFGDSFLL